MNTNTLHLDAYFELPFAARLKEARTPLPHTADRWNEGEQHHEAGHYAPHRYLYGEDDQTKLWAHRIYATPSATPGTFLICPEHYTPALEHTIAGIIGYQITLKFVDHRGQPTDPPAANPKEHNRRRRIIRSLLIEMRLEEQRRERDNPPPRRTIGIHPTEAEQTFMRELADHRRRHQNDRRYGQGYRVVILNNGTQLRVEHGKEEELAKEHPEIMPQLEAQWREEHPSLEFRYRIEKAKLQPQTADEAIAAIDQALAELGPLTTDSQFSPQHTIIDPGAPAN